MRLWTIAYDCERGRLFHAGNDGVIRMVNSGTLAGIANIPGHSSWIRAMRIFNGGRNIISGSEDQSLRVWDVESFRCLNTVRGVGSRIFSIATRENAIFCGTGSHKVVRFTRRSRAKGAKEEDLLGHKDQVFVVSCAKRDGILASGSDDGYVLTWSCRTARKISEAKLHSGWIGALAFSPNERLLASGGDDRAIVIQDLQAGSKTLLSGVHKSRISGLKFVGNSQLIAMGEAGFIGSIDLHTNKYTVLPVTSNLLYSLDVISYDPVVLICGDSVGQLHQVDLARGASRVIYRNEASAPIWSIAKKEGDNILAFGTDEGCLRFFDLDDLMVTHTAQAHDGQVWSLAWTDDGGALLTAGEDGTVAIWRAPWQKEYDRIRASRLYERMNLKGAMGLGVGEIDILRKLGAHV